MFERNLKLTKIHSKKDIYFMSQSKNIDITRSGCTSLLESPKPY